MTNIDVKIRLVMRLNSKLKRLELYLLGGTNAPKFMQSNYNNAIVEHSTIKNVLTNLNYLNY
jgi:hypothetical protein